MIPRFHKFVPALMVLALISTLGLTAAEAVSIARVEQMPNVPEPFQMRNWRQVTVDYLDMISNTNLAGPHLPLIRWTEFQPPKPELPSYVGGKGGAEAINFLAAVVSGSLVGMDMNCYKGRNWVALSTNYFNSQTGVCGNDRGNHGGSSGSFWYDLFPNVLFYQICALNPGDPARDQMLLTIAEHWAQVVFALETDTNHAGMPDFDHTAYDLQAMKPIDNSRWIEPDSAAGVAWLEYMAWNKFKDPRFLAAANSALRTLLARPQEKNPLYEILLPYGALTAARMNAELGRDYDVNKLLNWCFEPMAYPAARPGWGVLVGKFGEYDCSGLVGSATDTEGYAFAMNTFEWAAALAPIARYDPRYARAIGKWMLNLANASRLFYANGLPADQQDHCWWAGKYDPNHCLAYEGLRKHPNGKEFPQPYATGDAYVGSGSNVLNLCLYGSSHVGILGGIISCTSEPAILKLDLLRTDYFHARAYPAFLFYNPYPARKECRADFGPGRVDLYDPVADKTLVANVSGLVFLKLQAQEAVLIEAIPAGGARNRHRSGQYKLDNTVTGWRETGAAKATGWEPEETHFVGR